VSRLLPIGYVTIRDAAEMIAQSMFAGVPDRAIVAKLRQTEGDVADGQALDDAISELWHAVDSGKVRSFIIGSRPDPLKLSAALTRGIPVLRSPRGRGFTHLRPTNPYYRQFAAWFGPDFSQLTVAFREEEVTNLARRLVRARRRTGSSAGIKKSTGRPLRQGDVAPIIREVIASKKWTPAKSQKAGESSLGV